MSKRHKRRELVPNRHSRARILLWDETPPTSKGRCEDAKSPHAGIYRTNCSLVSCIFSTRRNGTSLKKLQLSMRQETYSPLAPGLDFATSLEHHPYRHTGTRNAGFRTRGGVTYAIFACVIALDMRVFVHCRTLSPERCDKLGRTRHRPAYRRAEKGDDDRPLPSAFQPSGSGLSLMNSQSCICG